MFDFIKKDNSFPFYYGWIIAGIALISMGFWFGVRSIFSIFYVALLDDFAWKRGETAGVQSLAFLTYSFMAPIVGGFMDRLGPRKIVIPGIILMVVGLILCSFIQTLFHFYLFFGLITALGSSCIGPVLYTVILSRWFRKKLGFASGLAISGVGLSVLLLVPLSQSLISLWGWRSAFWILGGIAFFVLLPFNFIFLRQSPEDLGLQIDGIREDKSFNEECFKEVSQHSMENSGTIRSIIKKKEFWAFMALNLFAGMSIYIIIVHHVRYLVDIGIDKMTAALVFASTGVITSIFRIFWGWLSDHIGREKTYTIGVSLFSMGIVFLIALESSARIDFLYLFIFFFGIGWAVSSPMIMSAAADIFQGGRFGLVFGIFDATIACGGACGAWIAGFIFDKNQSYEWAFNLAVACSLLSCLFIWVAAPRKVFNVRERNIIKKGN